MSAFPLHTLTQYEPITTMQMSYYIVHLAAQALFFVHCIVKTEMVNIYIKVCQGSRVMFNILNLNHHPQFNQAKTELLAFPAPPTLQHDFTIQMDSATITPSSSVRNLGVIFNDQLTFKDHIAKTARSCRFALHIIRKIRPLSFLDRTTAMLF